MAAGDAVGICCPVVGPIWQEAAAACIRRAAAAWQAACWVDAAAGVAVASAVVAACCAGPVRCMVQTSQKRQEAHDSNVQANSGSSL